MVFKRIGDVTLSKYKEVFVISKGREKVTCNNGINALYYFYKMING